MARQIVIDIVGDDSKFTKTAEGTATKAKASFGQVALAGAALGIGMGIVDKAATAVMDAIGGSTEAAREDDASQRQLAGAYENTGRSQATSLAVIEELISANQRKGVSDSEQRKGIADFLDKTRDATVAMKLNAATIELAAAKEIPYAEAQAMVLSAASGKTKALEKAGVAVNKEMTATQMAEAVMNKFGGSMDRVAATGEGKLAASQEVVGESMERVGRLINGVSDVALPILMGAFAGLVTVLTDNVGPAVQFISDNMNVFGPIAAALGIGIATLLVPPVIAYAGAMTAAVAATLVAAAPFIAIGAAIAGVIFVLNEMGVLKTVAEWLGTVADAISKELQPVIKSVSAFVSGTLIPVLKTVAAAVLPPLKTALQTLGQVFGAVFGAIGTVVGVQIAVVKTAIGVAVTVFTTLWNTAATLQSNITNAFKNIVAVITGLPGKISSAARGMWDGIWNAFRGVLNTIVRGWNSLKFTLPKVDLGPLGTFGGFTLGTPNLPYFHAGGIVPGVPGSDVPIMAQAGEQITARKDVGRGDIHIHIGMFVGSGPDIDRLADLIAQRMRLAA